MGDADPILSPLITLRAGTSTTPHRRCPTLTHAQAAGSALSIASGGGAWAWAFRRMMPYPLRGTGRAACLPRAIIAIAAVAIFCVPRLGVALTENVHGYVNSTAIPPPRMASKAHSLLAA